MTRSPLDARPVDADKEAAVEQIYNAAFDGLSLRDEVWRNNNWNLKQPQVKELLTEGKDDAKLLTFMNDNYQTLRGLNNEVPMTLVNWLIPSRWGENNPRLFNERSQRIAEREANQGITLDDFRLFHELGIEKSRQKYVQERLLPESEQAAHVYGVIDGALGAGVAGIANLVLASEKVGALRGGKGALIGIAVTAVATIASSKWGAESGRKLVFSQYEDTQKRVDELKARL